MKKIIAIIPARRGSKGIPNKNIKLLGDKPLIAYPIELAKSIDKIDKIIVSTDSNEILNIAKKYGAQVPFIRPKELAEDDTPTLPVIQHCLDFLKIKENYKPDYVLLLYPTNPFLKKETVCKAIDILLSEDCNSVMSVEEDYGRFWQKESNKFKPFYPKRYLPRQAYNPLYKENGAIYFSKYDFLINNNNIDDKKDFLVDFDSIKLLIMEEGELIDIDTISDWKKAEKRLNI